jgi:hypothetical protein
VNFYEKRYNLFYLFFFFSALVLSAGIIEKEVTFSRDDFSFTQFKGYDVVSLKGAGSMTKLGEPALPQVNLSFVIPPGAEVSEVNITYFNKKEITGEYNILPAQPPRPTIKKEDTSFIKPKKYIYSLQEEYPVELIECPHTGSMGGYRIAGLLVHPLRYIPAEKKLIFYSRIRFQVVYEEGIYSVKSKTEKQKATLKKIIKKQVLNPEDLDSWSPPINRPSGNIRLSPDTADYVIITTSTYEPHFQSLVDWKTKKGIKTKVVNLSWIESNYTGDDTQERIRNFIIDANSNWETLWFLLAGDTDEIPHRIAWVMYVDGGWYDELPCDLYFSDLDRDWDADGDNIYGEIEDNVDMYPDVFVGRASINTVAECSTFVNKVLSYEKAPPFSFIKKELLLGEHLFGNNWGEWVNDSIAGFTPADYTISKLYESQGTLNKQAVLDSIEAGYHFIHHAAHGNVDVISTGPDAIFNSDLDDLTNGDFLSIYVAISCLPGAFDFDCYAEHWMNNPNGGGTAACMNSRYGWGSLVGLGPSDHLDISFFEQVFDYNICNIGLTLGNAKVKNIPEAYTNPYMRWCVYELNLFGDPEMSMWTDNPGELTVNHDAVIPVNGSSFSVNVTDGGLSVEGALVCLYKEGEVYEKGHTDAFGNIIFTLSPPPTSLGIMFCTVTKNNYLPYEGSVEVISPTTPWVVFDSYTVIDANDGNVDPGESIGLLLTLHNVGLDTAYSTTGILRTEDSYVTITDSADEFGDILPDSLASGVENFDFDVSPGCPAKHIINFELVARDKNKNTWISSLSVPISTPDISLSADTLNFDTIFIGYPDTLELQVNNYGRDTLDVSDITSDNTYYSVDIHTFSLLPDESQIVKVTFAPLSVGISTGNLKFESNDLDEPTLTVFLQGQGLEPPNISVSPDSLSDSLYTGETSTHTLKIHNTGGSDLNFDILIEQLDTSSTSLNFFADKSVKKHKVIAVGRPVSLNQFETQKFPFLPQSTISPSDYIDKELPFENTNSHIGPLSLGMGEEVFGNDDNEFYAGPRTRGNLFTCATSSTLIEHRLYLNPSTSTQLWFLVYEGESQVGTYNLISASDVTPAGPGLGWYSSGDINVPLIEGKYYLIGASFEESSYYYNQQGISTYPIPASFGELTAGAGWDWAPTTSFPPASTQDVPSFAFVDPVAYYQMLVTGRWVDCDSTSGTISAGDSMLLEVTFDATNLNGGDYFADIIIVSNDPDEPEDTVPAHLHVTGAPDIAASEDTLDYGIVFTGYSATDTLIVTNEGNDLLTVSDISADNDDYAVDITNFTLNPEETQEVVVTFTPSSLGTITGTLTIASDDPNEPMLNVFLQGEGLAPPDISVSPNSLSDSLLTGEISHHILTIRNTGESNLNFDILIEEAMTFRGAAYSKVRQNNEGNLKLEVVNLEKQNPLEHPHQPFDGSGIAPPRANESGFSTFDSVLSPDNTVFFDDMESGVNGWTTEVYGIDDLWHQTNVTYSSPTTSWWCGIEEQGDYETGNRINTAVISPTIDLRIYEAPITLQFFENYNTESGWDFCMVDVKTDGATTWTPLRGEWGNAPSGNSGGWIMSVLDLSAYAGEVIQIRFYFDTGDEIYNDYPGWFFDDVLITAEVPWVSVDSTSGTIPPDDSVNVEVTFDATGLNSGDYYADIIVVSNDPDEPEVPVSAHLNVTGVPDIAVSEDTLDYGIVFTGYSVNDTLIVENEGSDSLTIFDISSDNSDYTVDINNFTLNPGETQEIMVTFVPSSVGKITGNLTITSDDPDEATLNVFLQGEGMEPPDISVSPGSLSDNLLTGETSTHTLTIYNTGGSDLNFDISIEGTNPTTMSAKVSSNSFRVNSGIKLLGKEQRCVVNKNNRTNEAPADYQPMGMKKIKITKNGNSVLIIQNEAPWGYSSNEDILSANGIGYDMINTSYINSVDFSDYKVVLIPSDQPTSFYEAVNSFADKFNNYVESGGILEFHAAGWGWNSGDASLVTLPGNMNINFNYSDVNYLLDPTHSLVEGVQNPFTGSNASHSFFTNVPSNAIEIVEDEDNNTNLLEYTYGGGVVIAGGQTFEYALNHNEDAGIILENMIPYAFEYEVGVDWLYVGTASGTILPGDSAKIEVTFDATGLVVGDYYANIIISSNDPDEPEVTVPAHLHVTGTSDIPDIAVSADTLDYGIVYPGSYVTDTLIVFNAGTAPLIVSDISSNNADYSPNTTNFTLASKENQEVLITFSPSSMGAITGLLTIQSNDPIEPSLTVNMKGECIDPPGISVVPDSLSDTLTQGEISAQILTIYNTGVLDLIFEISIGENPLTALSKNKTPAANTSLSSQFEYLEVEKGKTVPPEANPVVLSVVGPDSFGYTWTDSDEESKCKFEWVDISSSGTIVPGLTDDNLVGPYPIGFEFPFYDSVFTEFYISSNGYIELGQTNDSSSSSNQPIPTSDNPNNIIAWCWDDLYPNGSVYYEDLGDKLVVQFVDYGEYGGSGRINAEVIIHSSGQIMIQYLNSYDGFDLSNNSVGIENITGTDGLQVTFNTDYIHDSLAVKFSVGPRWLSVDPVSDTISSGDSVFVEVTFDASKMSAGDHYTGIIIASNDPDNPETSIPAYLQILSAGIEENKIPEVFFVKQNCPNPFSANTSIQFGCPVPTKVHLLVYDVMGRIITVLINKKVEAGYHNVNWDGTTKSGRKVANSVYFYRMETDKGFNKTKKMIYLQ